MLPIELGWPISGNTGWGLYALHLALGLARQGRRVRIPQTGNSSDGIPATLLPALEPMSEPGDPTERRVRFDPWGNHMPKFVEIPNRYRVLLAVFEDTEAVDVETMNRYDLVLAPSQWISDLLTAKGVENTIWRQGYDSSVFYPAPKRRSDGRFMVFSGGKLEFRKGQDIVVEAFRRFLGTPRGKDAILVTAWQNLWPQTMAGIWESRYVKGVPAMKGPSLDIISWLEVNGIPRENAIDLGMLSQAEMANAIRECDVGLFPNRGDGATNMALVETLGCGLPCLAGGTGQEDVQSHGVTRIGHQTPVTLPCNLYRGMAGWVEADPNGLVQYLQAHIQEQYEDEQGRYDAAESMWEWQWATSTSQLHQLLALRADA